MPCRLISREPLEEVVDDRRGEPGGGLVEQDQARIGDERPGEREHLALAARERARTGAPPLVEQREHLDDALDLRARRSLPTTRALSSRFSDTVMFGKTFASWGT